MPLQQQQSFAPKKEWSKVHRSCLPCTASYQVLVHSGLSTVTVQCRQQFLSSCVITAILPSTWLPWTKTTREEDYGYFRTLFTPKCSLLSRRQGNKASMLKDLPVSQGISSSRQHLEANHAQTPCMASAGLLPHLATVLLKHSSVWKEQVWRKGENWRSQILHFHSSKNPTVS